jgi:hypothetical protein
MRPLHPIKVATTVALLMACIHFGWALLVAFGVAQSLLNFIFWLHFITPVYTIQPFSWIVALGLVLFTSTASFFAALLFVYLWNRIHVL